jgi:hypothetical protein
MGRWSNLFDQGERLQTLVDIEPSGPIGHNSGTSKQIHKRLRTSQVTELVAGYEAGATVYELADQFRISRGTVSSLLERRGVPRRGKPLDPSQIMRAVRLYLSGQSLAKIAPPLKCDPGTVRLALLRSGIKMRDSHGRDR